MATAESRVGKFRIGGGADKKDVPVSDIFDGESKSDFTV